MTFRETELMLHLLHRPGMFAGNSNKDVIIAFMTGLDIGKREEPHWTKLLSIYLEKEYNITRPAMGWPYQVEVFSKQNKLIWFEGFKKAMLQLIQNSEDITYTKELKEINEKFKKS